MGPPPSSRLFPALTTSSISCTPSAPLSTGMLEKVWKRANSLRLVRISPLSRRITKRLAPILLMMRRMNIKLPLLWFGDCEEVTRVLFVYSYNYLVPPSALMQLEDMTMEDQGRSNRVDLTCRTPETF